MMPFSRIEEADLPCPVSDLEDFGFDFGFDFDVDFGLESDLASGLGSDSSSDSDFASFLGDEW